jgi:hypothetical protein
MYSSNVNAPNFVKQALLGTKGQKGPDTKIVGDFINRQIIQTKKLTNFRVKLDLRSNVLNRHLQNITPSYMKMEE